MHRTALTLLACLSASMQRSLSSARRRSPRSRSAGVMSSNSDETPSSASSRSPHLRPPQPPLSTLLPPAPAAAVPAVGGSATPALAAAANHAAAPAARSPSVRLSYFAYGSLDPLVAGLSAGSVATLCLHPFDLIKTRMQVGGRGATLVGVPAATATVYRNSLHAARLLVHNEGWAALYKGLTPNLLGNAMAWGLYFFGFELIKRNMSQSEPMRFVQMVSNPAHLPSAASSLSPSASGAGAGAATATAAPVARPHRQLNALEHILAASLTGVCVSAITNPIWVVKTRMFLDHTPVVIGRTTATAATAATTTAQLAAVAPAAARGEFFYSSLGGALRSIYQTEGILGLYRGFIPGLFGVSHGALQFMAYEELKKWRLLQRQRSSASSSSPSASAPPSAHPHHVAWSPLETIGMSVASKSFASVATYPYQVLRSRMQASHGLHVTLRMVTSSTWAAEGLRGFYRGVWINTFKVMPAACTVFLVYEQVGGYMKRHATHAQG